MGGAVLLCQILRSVEDGVNKFLRENHMCSGAEGAEPTAVDWCAMTPKRAQRDPIELEVFKNLFHSIAEEMGAALRRTAFSPNIKERRDYSCAVFTGAADVIAMGDHMPVHLGSMPMSVRAAITDLELGPGDVA